jgi:AcrR family transcriptional regulator
MPREISPATPRDVPPPADDRRRERKKRDTRSRIVTVAWGLFVERGYAATTVQDISEAADIAERTFFRYFPTKDALLFADGEADAVALIDALRARPDTEPCWVALEHAYCDIASRLVARRDHLLLGYEIARGLGDQSGNWAMAVGRMRSMLDDVISARLGLPAGDRSADVIVRTAITVVGAAFCEWVESGAPDDLADRFTAAFGSLTNIIVQAAPPELAAARSAAGFAAGAMGGRR